jgi:hypothetical protein
MLERNPNLTPHQLITILRMEAASELAGWEHELRSTTAPFSAAKADQRHQSALTLQTSPLRSSPSSATS